MTARGAALPAALWAAAALVSAFTIRRYLEPFDEGLLLQAATRIADGQWPYRDFGWPYGPGQASAVALAFEAFSPSVIWWRVLRVAADATIAVVVWALVRGGAGGRPLSGSSASGVRSRQPTVAASGDAWALAAWAAAAVTVAQPTSANPFPVALAFALGAVLAAARGRTALAGLLAGLTVFWRLDLGLIAGAAAMVAAGAGGGAAGGRDRRPRVAGFAAGGRDRRPRVAGTSRGRPAAIVAAAWGAAAVVLYAPFAVASGPGRLFDELVGTAADDGGFWRLPFPLAYDGSLRGWPPDALAEDLKDVLGYYLPAIAVAGAVLVAAALVRRRRAGPEVAGLLVLGMGSALYLLTRPDELHVQPLLVCLCALVPLVIAATAPPPPRSLRLALAGVLGLILLAGAANRLSALLLPPELEPVRLAGVPGIRVPPPEARALPPLVARVQRLVPPGQPIYVAPRRSDLVTLSAPLVHFLVRRPNVLFRDVSLQARPGEQRRIVGALRRVRPRAVVRWTDPASARPEPNRRGRPTGSRALDEHLAAAYRLDARFGAYDVLVPR